MNPVKADAVVRIGYYKLALWGSYTLTNMMEKNKAPEIHRTRSGLGVNFVPIHKISPLPSYR